MTSARDLSLCNPERSTSTSIESCVPHAALVATLLLSGCVSSGTSRVVSESSHRDLQIALDNKLAEAFLPESIAAMRVVSLQDGRTLYETNPRLLVSPASVQKLFTAAAVLEILGPEYQFETSVSVDAERNALQLHSCGDPLLSTVDIDVIAQKVALALAQGVHYTLSGDATCFDDKYWGAGWMWDDEPNPDAMYISALSVNGNTVEVTVRPGESLGMPLRVSVEPQTDFIQVDNTGTTAESNTPCVADISRPAGERDNIVRVSGALELQCPPVTRRVTVWSPQTYTLTLLAERLERLGVDVQLSTANSTTASGAPLALVSHSLLQVLSLMLKASDNLSAESVLKHLGRAAGRPGNTADGLKAVTDWLERAGIPLSQVYFVDGSGLSRYNLVTAQAITTLLEVLYRNPKSFPTYWNSLAIAGVDGQLATRMLQTKASGIVRGKTGSMRGVSALAGYATTSDGEPIAFAILMQNFVGSLQRVRDLQDELVVILSEYSVKGRSRDWAQITTGDAGRVP